jgi:hypothetical protein
VKNKVFVVKLQVPIASSDPNPQCLVYNEDRSKQWFVPIDANIKRAMKGRPKAFFPAELKGKTLLLGTESEVPDQGW